MTEQTMYDILNEFEFNLTEAKGLVKCAGGEFFLVDSYKDELNKIIEQVKNNYASECVEAFNQKLEEFNNFEKKYTL